MFYKTLLPPPRLPTPIHTSHVLFSVTCTSSSCSLDVPEGLASDLKVLEEEGLKNWARWHPKHFHTVSLSY